MMMPVLATRTARDYHGKDCENKQANKETPQHFNSTSDAHVLHGIKMQGYSCNQILLILL